MGAARLGETGVNPDDSTFAMLFEVIKVLYGFARRLSQHVGGFVITRDWLDHLIPISNAVMEDRTVIEWNKDDLDDLGILTVDVLALAALLIGRNCHQ